ncbi:[Fe-Fe] hydrogenase large subunit C-terminal domain-containing protein [Crassaminicella profunda]|uniref:[Fe-Fe] hydrogenase large subunit C-terminal domain-containing protein n=1 Tax=Crassaminicella profunda TaxID=1286698 RepID=UPI001CA6596F|nr:[Fe-Fe] hydrogenase large subunit C-terminal domain-containing protein [Crassaminicella profunda]QZY56145.1 4Fe-4S dicluster domain-containing protein [Crassaminicella profunda]
MTEHFHSVILEEDKCIGCTNCIKKCPTEAIRVKNGKARIIKERCIDCGECIRICPQHAKNSISDPLENIHHFKYKVALPAPTLLGQFDENTEPIKILSALKALGFDDVYEVSRGADIVSNYTRELLKNPSKLPLISSSCPVVVRLIQIRFPSLIDHIVPIESPMEVAAMLAREKSVQKTGLAPSDIGIFFISPCPAKISSVKNPLGNTSSHVDGVISIQSVYPCIQKNLKKDLQDEASDFYDSGKAIGWARAGGETYSLSIQNYLCVDGIENVIKILDEIENGKLEGIEFVECLACINGCVGGCLTVENPFIARNRIRKLSQKYMKNKEIHLEKTLKDFMLQEKIHPKNVRKLDDNIMEAMKKMEQIDQVYDMLPDLDCGACGSPSCRALAEDIVLGYSDLDDCMILFRDKVKNLLFKKENLNKDK